ncbi:hypothetical protein [Desulfarculus baarsii]
MNPLLPWVGHLFQAAAVVYVLAALAGLARAKGPAVGLLALGLAANLASIGLKLYLSWPMQAPFQEPFWLPAALALLTLGLWRRGHASLLAPLCALIAVLAGWAAIWPKDFYLPFPRSNTIVAHIFLPLSAAGKACFYAAGLAAMPHLAGRRAAPAEIENGRTLFGRLIVWGFVLFTLSLFLAEAWSYLGWASPVIWNNATMTSTMAVWFYYGCFLHLHLLRMWPLGRRAWLALAGLPLLIVFTFLPETGGLRLAGWAS